MTQTPRLITTIQLGDVFHDFERDGLCMSWVYGNIGSLLNDTQIQVFASAAKVSEKVDIHRLRQAFRNDDEHDVQYRVGLLGSSLKEQGIPDSTKICDFVSGKSESYDNSDHFGLIYDFKQLTAYVTHPYAIPFNIAGRITSDEWKSLSLSRDFTSEEAKIFSRENRLSRLHHSTTLHVDLVELQIEVSKLAELIGRVRMEHGIALPDSKVLVRIDQPQQTAGPTKQKVGRSRKPWWSKFWAQLVVRSNELSLESLSKNQLKLTMEQLADEMEIEDVGESLMSEPARELWNAFRNREEQNQFDSRNEN